MGWFAQLSDRRRVAVLLQLLVELLSSLAQLRTLHEQHLLFLLEGRHLTICVVRHLDGCTARGNLGAWSMELCPSPHRRLGLMTLWATQPP